MPPAELGEMQKNSENLYLRAVKTTRFLQFRLVTFFLTITKFAYMFGIHTYNLRRTITIFQTVTLNHNTIIVLGIYFSL